MPYVTSIERLAREEGIREGRGKEYDKAYREGFIEGSQNAVLYVLKFRFKRVGAKHTREVRSVHELKRLRALVRAAVVADTIDQALSSIRDR